MSAALAAPARPPRPALLPSARPEAQRRARSAGFRRGKGARLGGAAGLARPRPLTEQLQQQVTAGRGPLASGRAGRGGWAGFARLPAGAGPRLTPGSSLGRSGQGRAVQAWFLLSGPSWARLQPRLAHAPGPVGKGQRRAKASRPDSSPPGPRPTGQPGGRMVPRRDFLGQNLPGRKRMKTGLPQTGPGQCLCFRASLAVSRDRQFSAAARLNSGNGREGGPFCSVLKRNQIGGGSVT